MAKFEKVSRFADVDIAIPTIKTSGSAGHDFEVAEDIIIPPYTRLYDIMKDIISPYVILEDGSVQPRLLGLSDVAQITKLLNTKPSLVSTGMKCQLDPGTYLELSVRSSCPLKHWLILANSVGVIDADYYNNPDNEGEIFFQLINLSPFNIQLKKGDIIGQGIIKSYLTTEDENPTGERTGGFGSTNG